MCLLNVIFMSEDFFFFLLYNFMRGVTEMIFNELKASDIENWMHGYGNRESEGYF